MTNHTNNTTAIDTNTTIAIDEAADQYAEYLDSFTSPAFDGTLRTSYAEAQRIRDSYRQWLLRKLNNIERGHNDLLKQLENCDDENRCYLEQAIEEYELDNDTSFLIGELEGLQSADDSGVNIWNTRPEVGDVEYGLTDDAPRWFDQGWTVPREVDGRPNPERDDTHPAEFCNDDSIVITPSDVKAWQDSSPALCWTDEVNFEVEGDTEKAKAQAHQFILSTMQSWKTKGDHDVEVLWPRSTWTFETKEEAQAFVNLVRATKNRKAIVHACRTPKKSESGLFEAEVSWPMQQNGAGFKVATLKADGNWGSWDNYGHRRMRAHARDCYVQDLLERIENADANQLNAIRREAGRASRDNQVLTFDKKVGRPAHTHDGGQVIKTKNGFRHTGRKVGIGLNFERYATVMNAAAARADELGITGYRTYKVDQFEKTERPEKDGDMLDSGCAVGEFVALEMDSGERLDESLWKLQEKTWKPSATCLKRLKAAGPTGFIFRSWEEILSDADSDWCMTQCGSLAA